MAPKRKSPPPAEDPPSSSSSKSSYEESSDEEVTPAQPPPPPAAPTKKPSSSAVVPPRTTVEAKSKKVAEEKLQSSDEEEDESDSSSESDVPPSPQKLITDLNAKPASSKSAVVAPGPSSSPKEKPKLVLKKSTVTPLAAATKPGKRAKKDGEASDPVYSERKPLFQRLWNEEEEIVILKGIINFISERGLNPLGHVNAFYKFIHKSLASGGTQAQLANKIRSLKKKYRKHASK